MSRIKFASLVACVALAAVGCRGYKYGHLIQDDQADMVGSHAAGGAVYKPLVEESVGKLLGACQAPGATASFTPEGFPVPRRICFVGVENRSSEELGDFKEQLYELIDARINQSGEFSAIDKRMVDVALRDTRLRPDDLLLPDNMRMLTTILQRDGQPVDYLLFAKLTSGTTDRNKSSQRDYLLTLDLVDTRTGAKVKESAEISKGYHKSVLGKLTNYSLFPAGR